ncbi:uncharacterized protein [Oscarella lobularis]|uniref:uncharacterized protein n=1 Tax=Oscarella lobularis TaxID=121494 RepID=UPI003313E10E
MLRSLSLALLLLTPIVDAASCLTTAFVLNLYPSWKYRAQVVFSGHRFAALSYGDHAIALFRVDMNDSVQVALVNKNGAVIAGPDVRNVTSKFPRPLPAKCRSVLIADPTESADGIDFLFHVENVDSTLSQNNSYYILYNALQSSDAIDVFIYGLSPPHRFMYLGHCIRPRGVKAYVTPGRYEIKVFACGLVRNESDYHRLQPLIDPIVVDLEQQGEYYMAVHGKFNSKNYPPSFTVIPSTAIVAATPSTSSKPSIETSIHSTAHIESTTLASTTFAPSSPSGARVPKLTVWWFFLIVFCTFLVDYA